MKLALLALLTAACAPAVVKHTAEHRRHVEASRLEPATPQPTRASRSHARKPLATVHPIRSHSWDVTAYCETGSKTASGVWPRRGMAATLSRRIPFGTRLRVPGIGLVTVTDRIGHGSDLDIYLGGSGCEQLARNFGRRHLTVVEVTA